MLDALKSRLKIDLSKQQKIDPKAIQQINFTGNLDEDGNKKIFLIRKEAKETDEQMVHQLI